MATSFWTSILVLLPLVTTAAMAQTKIPFDGAAFLAPGPAQTAFTACEAKQWRGECTNGTTGFTLCNISADCGNPPASCNSVSGNAASNLPVVWSCRGGADRGGCVPVVLTNLTTATGISASVHFRTSDANMGNNDCLQAGLVAIGRSAPTGRPELVDGFAATPVQQLVVHPVSALALGSQEATFTNLVAYDAVTGATCTVNNCNNADAYLCIAHNWTGTLNAGRTSISCQSNLASGGRIEIISGQLSLP